LPKNSALAWLRATAGSRLHPVTPRPSSCFDSTVPAAPEPALSSSKNLALFETREFHGRVNTRELV
jgi:hypothetical protein